MDDKRRPVNAPNHSIYVRHEDWEQIKKMAKEAGMTVSAFIVKCVLKTQ
jgi:hypothetical protein